MSTKPLYSNGGVLQLRSTSGGTNLQALDSCCALGQVTCKLCRKRSRSLRHMETVEKSKLTLLERVEIITKATFERYGFNPELGQVGASAKGKIADFQCNGAMAAARQAQRK